MSINIDFKNLFKKPPSQSALKQSNLFDISANNIVFYISSNKIKHNNPSVYISSNKILLNAETLDISSNTISVINNANKKDETTALTQDNTKNKIVVIYTFFMSDVADYNLKFFAKKELAYRANIDYIIVINGYLCNVTFPDIKNLIILKRENTGFDFGGHAYALNYLKGKKLTYKYYFFMNSSVFGPIIPAYIKNHWSDIFIEKLVGLVKIVSTSIVCLEKKDLGGYGPKAESFFFLTDYEGLELLLKEGSIFCSHKDKVSAIINGEYGVTRCIMKHGFTIDCILQKYRGVDWLDKKNWNINNNLHPTRRNTFFGKSINPYEVIFHKWYWANLPTVNYDIVKHYVEQSVIE